MKKILLILILFYIPVVYGRERIEVEKKFSVSSERVEELWSMLRKKFDEEEDVLKTSFSDEIFTDVYYDDRKFTFFQKQGGLRRRSREVSSGHDLKDGRSLIQIKANNSEIKDSRMEFKFGVKKKLRSAHHWIKPIDLIEDNDRSEFLDLLDRLGVRSQDLFVSLVIKQRRRRISFFLDDRPIMTISLDQSVSSKWWASTAFTELEVEINEAEFTSASPEERLSLLARFDHLVSDLRTIAPYLRPDNIPKYPKMLIEMKEAFPLYERIIWLEAFFQ